MEAPVVWEGAHDLPLSGAQNLKLRHWKTMMRRILREIVQNIVRTVFDCGKLDTELELRDRIPINCITYFVSRDLIGNIDGMMVDND